MFDVARLGFRLKLICYFLSMNSQSVDCDIRQQLDSLLDDFVLGINPCPESVAAEQSLLKAQGAFQKQLNLQSKMVNPVYKCHTTFSIMDSDGVISLICTTINPEGTNCQYQSKSLSIIELLLQLEQRDFGWRSWRS